MVSAITSHSQLELKCRQSIIGQRVAVLFCHEKYAKHKLEVGLKIVPDEIAVSTLARRLYRLAAV